MRKPNIVLIIMDAVRAQNMSLYGYEKETNPNLKKILEMCVLYKNAISSSNWTLPSMTSLFTGTYVSKHGLIMHGDVLNSKFSTIAEMLRKEGYRTFSFSRTPYVSDFTGLDGGFEAIYGFRQKSVKTVLYELLHREVAEEMQSTERKTISSFEAQNYVQKAKNRHSIFQRLIDTKYMQEILWSITRYFDKSATNLNKRAKKSMKKSRNKPFFLNINYNETHMPYIVPGGFREKFVPVCLKKKVRYVNQDHRKYYSGEARMDETDFLMLQMLYDGAIAYLDLKIYEIFQFLEKQDLLDDTMAIITSDHGESFGEHGIMFHVFSLYDTLIKIPLLIKYPAELNLHGIEDRIVKTIDIFPTIVDVTGVTDKTLNCQLQGKSLATSSSSGLHTRNNSMDYAISEIIAPFHPSLKPLQSSLKKYDRQLISIRTKDAKYIYSSDGKDEFYDLQKDPHELSNLIYSQDSRIPELKEKLRLWIKSFISLYERRRREIEGESRVKFSEEIKARLRQLGYL